MCLRHCTVGLFEHTLLSQSFNCTDAQQRAPVSRHRRHNSRREREAPNSAEGAAEHRGVSSAGCVTATNSRGCIPLEITSITAATFDRSTPQLVRAQYSHPREPVNRFKVAPHAREYKDS